jgi:hypothetical protein
VYAQACAVQSANGAWVQAAVIVRNSRSTVYGAEAAMELWNLDGRVGRWTCARSGVGPKSWSVCFGDSLPGAGSHGVPESGVNGQPVHPSPWI